jgi:hypothetical protein
MSDFSSDTNTDEVDLDFTDEDGVEDVSEGVYDEDEIPGTEGAPAVTDDDEFETTEVVAPTIPTVVEAPEGSTGTAGTKPKVTPVEEIDPSEFKFDATPRPRQPKAEDGEQKPAGAKRSKDPLPEGWVTPTQLVKILRDERIVNLRPQAAFGLVKNGKNFPFVNHSDGRYIVPLEDGKPYNVQVVNEETGEKTIEERVFEVGARTWITRHFEAKAKRDAERAAKAASSTETPQAVVDGASQPEVGGEGVMAAVES